MAKYMTPDPGKMLLIAVCPSQVLAALRRRTTCHAGTQELLYLDNWGLWRQTLCSQEVGVTQKEVIGFFK